MTILDLLRLNEPQRMAATLPGDLVVTAGAGAGKTRTLVARYLALLESGVPLRGIAAITFTDKAAREMRTRIRQAISDWLAEDPPRRAFWEEATAGLDGARIGTIHGLCAQILRAQPVEAARLGLLPDFVVLEEGRAAVLRARAVEEALAWAAADPAAARLFGALGELGLRQAVSSLLEKRLDADAAFERLTEDPLQSWAAALQRWLGEALDAAPWQAPLEALAALRADDPADKMELARQEVLAHAAAVVAARQQGDLDAAFVSLAALRAATALVGRKANWPGDGLEAAKAAMRELRACFDERLRPLTDPDRPASWMMDAQVAGMIRPLQATYRQAIDIYAQARRAANAVDFDDLEAGAVALLAMPDARTAWQAATRAVLVDEFQDTNERQRRIIYALGDIANPMLLSPETQSRGLFVVGDPKQCFVPGTPILTSMGYRLVEQVPPGAEVIAASGRGQTNTFQVEQVYQHHYAGPIITVTTAKGFEVQCTPEHALFTRLIPDMDAYYVYLMQHRAKGYRIGITLGYRTGERRITNGLDSRCRQEGGDAIWVLNRCHSRKEAQVYEQLYLAKYGLPGLCFKSKDYQELDQEAIDFVFASIPTQERAAVLANDMGIDLTTPHYMPTVARETVALVYFGGKENRRYATHRIHFETRDAQTAQKLTELGIRKAKPSRYYPHRWRVATERADYETARDFSSRVAQQADTLLVERFALTRDKRWEQTPAGQVFPGLQIPVVDNGHVVPDEIVRVVREQFEGPVYDLAIQHVHNYVANHILVHNSIYRFRGADVTVFRRVEADVTRAGGRVIPLDLTFRAHRALVETTNRLLAPILGEIARPDRPYAVPFTPLIAHRTAPRAGIAPPFVEFHLGLGESAEAGRQATADGLAARLHELRGQEGVAWQDVALLFRASSAFAVYEDALERAGIPFVTVAGRGFYDRPEVRNLLNALRAVADPGDDLAVVGFLRSPFVGLTDAALYRLRFPPATAVPRAPDRPCSPWAILNHPALPDIVPLDDLPRAVRGRELLAGLHAMAGRAPVATLLKQLLDQTHYRALLQTTDGGSRAQRNVDKLLADAHTSGQVSVREFTEYVRTLRDVGARESEAPTEAGSAVQLMTVHKAKGLEFPVVVIADAAHAGRRDASQIRLDDELGVTVDPPNRGDAGPRPAAHQLAALRGAERDAAEDCRLLYVAATRAQEKLLVSAHTRLLKGGGLSTSGWLELLGKVTGLDAVALPEAPAEAQTLALADDIGCKLYTQAGWVPRAASDALAVFREESSPLAAASRIPASADSWNFSLVAPLATPPPPDTDPRLHAREAQPPRRVWRVVPRTERSDAPAWVVGTLVHAALRHWTFADAGLDAFLHPFALEMGVVDEKQLHAAIVEARRMLRRFRAHALWTELDSARRWHEVAFSIIEGERAEHGIVDLLCRTTDGWKIAEFKTDQVRSAADLPAHIRAQAYDRQMRRYARAVRTQLGVEAQTLFVFLNVGNEVVTVGQLS